jgi:cytokinesis protein
LQNQTIAEQKLALERRRQAHEENRSNRQKEQEAMAGDEHEGALEKLLTDLRNGDTISRKARRRRPAPENQLASLPLNLDDSTTSNVARDMLARLQSDGFEAIPSQIVATQHRRRRRRTERIFDSEEMPGSPLAIEIQENDEDSVSETQDLTSGIS